MGFLLTTRTENGRLEVKKQFKGEIKPKTPFKVTPEDTYLRERLI